MDEMPIIGFKINNEGHLLAKTINGFPLKMGQHLNQKGEVVTVNMKIESPHEAQAVIQSLTAYIQIGRVDGQEV